MNFSSTRKVLPVLLLIAMATVATVRGQSLEKAALLQSEKLSTAAQKAIETTDNVTPIDFWLYLDKSCREVQPITLSERARKRRAKADPVNLLITNSDYPIRKSFVDSIKSTGVSVHAVSRWLGAVAVSANLSELERLTVMPYVRKVELNRTFARPYNNENPPDQKSKDQSSALELPYGNSAAQNRFVNVTKLHTLGYLGGGVAIALLDSGFKTDHPLLDAASVIGTYDFINDRIDVTGAECPGSGVEQDHHGTLVMGVLAADSTDHLIGIAPMADYLLAKTEITCGNVEVKIEEYNWVEAAEWADSAGADIISSSLGYNIFDDSGSYSLSDLDGNTAAITIAADEAAAKNILVVISAGNERGNGWNRISFPADGDSVLAVGAVDPDSVISYFSSPGPTADGRIKPDIVTLGSSIWTTSRNDGLTTSSGTSLSAPLVTGGAALALEFDNSLTAKTLLERIRQHGDRAEKPDNDYGFGLFNALRASTIIRIDDIPPVWLEIGQQIEIDVTTSGLVGAIPAISLLNPPIWATLSDHNDGTATIYLDGTDQNPSSINLSIELDDGSYVDTTIFSVVTIASSVNPVFIGPNPFTDSISFFVNPQKAIWVAVSIFNTAGEKVWERFNISSATADTPIVWDGHNSSGRKVASGVYLAIVQTETRSYRFKLLNAD